MTLATNSLTNELGTGAPDFPAGMPTVAGDPVVESGSNSDGEWTRWADGTQHCFKKALELPYNAASDCRANWNFPVTFINFEASIFTTYLYLTDFSSAQRLDSIMVDVNNNSTTSTATSVRVFMQAGNFIAGDLIRVQSLAVGRWK